MRSMYLLPTKIDRNLRSCIVTLAFILTSPILAKSQSENSLKKNLIRLRVYQAPPLYYRDQNNQWQGIDFDIARQVILNAGFKIELVQTPWKRALVELAEGSVDFMMSVGRTKEREEKYYWIGPYRKENMHLIVHQDDKDLKISSVDDLLSILKSRKLALGVLNGVDLRHPKLQTESRFRSELNYISNSTSIEQQLNMTVKRRIFGCAEIETLASYWITNRPKYSQLVIHPFVFYTDDVYFAINKGIGAENYQRLLKSFENLQLQMK